MKGNIKYLAVPYLILILVMFTLPFFSVESYSIIKNTTSQLGAQNTPNAWIMNFTFILLATGSLLSGWKYLKGYMFHRIVLLVFSFALIMSAIYQHSPIDPNIEFSAIEDDLHSKFSSLTGFSFTLFAISTSFILKYRKDKIFAVSVGVLATILSILIFNWPEFKGIWQRLIFLGSFGWMILLFRNHVKS